MSKANEPNYKERTLTTAARGMNELVIVPATSRVPPDEFRVFVRVDEPDYAAVIVPSSEDDPEPDVVAVRRLYKMLAADDTSTLMVLPASDGGSWSVAEIPKDRDESVLVSRGSDNDTQAAVARLYRAIGGEPHPEDEELKDLESALADDDLRRLVLPIATPSTARRSMSVKDLVDALFSIADMPGDPGRTVDLLARARAIREMSDAARKGRR